MISKPKYGWSSICFDENKPTALSIPLSYIEPIPQYFLKEFINGLKNTFSSIVLDVDTEGNSFKIITDQYRTYIINEGMNQLYCFDLNKLELIEKCVKDFEDNIKLWAEWDVFEESEIEHKIETTNNYNELLGQIKIVKGLLTGKE